MRVCHSGVSSTALTTRSLGSSATPRKGRFKQVFTNKLERVKISYSHSSQDSHLWPPTSLQTGWFSNKRDLEFVLFLPKSKTKGGSLCIGEAKRAHTALLPLSCHQVKVDVLRDDGLVQGLRFRDALKSNDTLLPTNQVQS